MTSAGSSQGASPDLPDPAGMRASDAERERIAEVLREAVAEGRLDMEEFDERLNAAYTARTHGELEPLVRDLPVPGGAAPAPPAPADPGGWRERIGGTPTSSMGIAIMGGFQRKGTWTVPRRFTAFTLMGGGEIDLREARFEDREVVIRCFALMGGVQITVEPGVDTHVSGIGIMGGFDHSGGVEGEPGAPRVTVTGLALFGGVSVERKLRKEEHKRLKEERRRVKAERRDELRTERRELRGARRDGRREEREERRLSLEKDRRRDDY
ncbi:DUF1707 domain-containing protein [Streptomyces sp. NPDC021218]|uniref:DUF1707 SHOCT-like domain-containing protein n=1 Tax=unclassified Streptomyces TaxID=2593676 RepID=UPI00379A38B9